MSDSSGSEGGTGPQPKLTGLALQRPKRKMSCGGVGLGLGSSERNERNERTLERERERGTGSHPLRRRKSGISARERNLRRLESNERERMRMHSLNDAFEVKTREGKDFEQSVNL